MRGFKKHPQYWLPAGIVLLNLILKYWQVEETSIYLDEAASAFHCQMTWGDFTDFLSRDANPPLYYLVLRGWTNLFGIDEWSIRGLSVIFSSLTAGLIFALGRKHLNLATGLMAAGLYTFSAIHLNFAHEARCFAMLSCLYVLSWYQFLNWMREGRRQSLVLLVLVNTALMYTHYAILPGLLAQGLISLLFLGNMRRWRIWFMSQLGVALVLLSLILLMTDDKMGSTARWIPIPEAAAFRKIQFAYTGGRFWAFGFMLLVILGAGLSFLTGKGKEGRKMLALTAGWAWGTLAIAWLLSQYSPFFLGKYVLYASLGIYLAVAIVLGQLPSWGKWLACALIWAFGAWGFSPHKAISEDWKGAVGLVKNDLDQGHALIVTPDYQLKTFAYYYDRESWQGYAELTVYMIEKKVFCMKKMAPEFFDYQDHKHYVLLQSHSAVTDPQLQTETLLRERFNLERQVHLPGIKLSWFGPTDP